MGPSIAPPPLRAQAFAVSYQEDDVEREISRLEQAGDIEGLEKMLARFKGEVEQDVIAAQKLDAAFVKSFREALDAGYSPPPEMLPPSPPMLFMALVTEHRLEFWTPDPKAKAPVKDSGEQFEEPDLIPHPADVGVPAQVIKERSPDYYTAKTVDGRQEIRARFAESLTAAICREAVRRECNDMTLTFKWREPPKTPWTNDAYMFWDELLTEAHAKHTPAARLEFHFKALMRTGLIKPSHRLSLSSIENQT